jgi:hypothetical protein
LAQRRLRVREPLTALNARRRYPPGYVYGQVTFTLNGLTTSNITISDVAGAYGTAPEATPAATIVNTSTPEPATFDEAAGTWRELLPPER